MLLEDYNKDAFSNFKKLFARTTLTVFFQIFMLTLNKHIHLINYFIKNKIFVN